MSWIWWLWWSWRKLRCNSHSSALVLQLCRVQISTFLAPEITNHKDTVRKKHAIFFHKSICSTNSELTWNNVSIIETSSAVHISETNSIDICHFYITVTLKALKSYPSFLHCIEGSTFTENIVKKIM